MDQIIIRNLLVRCTIGIMEWERKVRQDVRINLTLDTELAAAGASDAITDTVDYKQLTKRIITLAEESQFYLVEALAENIARICLEDPKVSQVQVAVEKPGALRFAESVGVVIIRKRNSSPHEPST